MGDKTVSNEGKAIRLRLVGEIPDYYRSYYEDEDTGAFYALMNYRSVRTWFTTSRNGGEPNMPLPDGLLIEIVAPGTPVTDGQVISREIISRVNDCTSIGQPVPEGYKTPPGRARRTDGKKAAMDNPTSPLVEEAAPTE